ncbi:DNA-binding protein [Rhizobium sp. M1]|nr:DNA-binding protein [Rhizobium sp. M1]
MWKCLFHRSPQKSSVSRFVDLAPASNADQNGVYFEALQYATTNKEVLNIALTGPYGSGKSSVIKSFLLKYRGKTLQLSLASFLPEGEASGKSVSKQEIERSILQQILYGADADRLPLSRFKRIQTPSRGAAISSLAVCVGMSCLWYLFTNQSDVTSGKFFKPFESSNWFNLLSFFIGAVFVWRLVHNIYLKSFGFSLKSISLKDIQIAPNAADQESILNRHLDEIIYFFQSTKYDLVVIEDLDRFENPDIFVTLREINGLVNANAGIHRRVRFLYALRDDIFINTDRTKFFEFIVPVIPLINHSNSIDKVLEHGQRIELDARLERRFVRDVSRYLSDMRLIGNIFNEYVIYSSNLKADRDGVLDPNKLLAILIYKNVMPKDFAALHRQEGALSNVLNRYDEYVAKVESRIRTELVVIQTDLANGEAQCLRDLEELRSVYAMAIIERIPSHFTHLSTEFGQIALGQLSRHAEFENLLSHTSLSAMNNQGQQRGVEVRGVEAVVDPTRTFVERKAAILSKSADSKERMDKKIQELKDQLAGLRTTKFNEVVRESAALIEEVFAEVGENRDLLKFLILEGYLDDTYYQYISLFHSGRLSPNDNKFLIQIRSYNTPDPDFQLDNVSEVVASMRENDFGRNFVLNRFIVDHLLEHTHKSSQHIAAAVEFIAGHFDDCADFFSSYYARGAHVDRLVSTLASNWPSFPVVALRSAQSASHAARILAYAPESVFVRGTPVAFSLSRYFSLNLNRVLHEQLEFDLSRLQSIGIQLADIPSIQDFGHIVSFVAANGLYRISVGNIRHIMEHVVNFPALDSLETRHFSSVREANDDGLLRLINSNFETYVSEVLLKLEKNTAEDLSAITEVLSREEVKFEFRAEFLSMQTARFPSFEGVPAAFHPSLLKEQKIEDKWENCRTFLASEGYSPEVLTAYLRGIDTSATLSQEPVPSGDAWAQLRRFLIENDDLPDDVYRLYVRKLPNSFNAFPAVGATKIKVLIDENKVTFSPENFGKMEDENLKVLFIASNFESYQRNRDKYPIQDEFRRKLLDSHITDIQKLRIIADIDPVFVAGNVSVAAAIGPILDRSAIVTSDYGPDFVRAVVLNSRPDELQISLLNKLQSVLSTTEVRDVLRDLPDPYRDIALFGRYPRIDNSEINQQLASWLKERSLISSFAPTMFGAIRINTFRKEP